MCLREQGGKEKDQQVRKNEVGQPVGYDLTRSPDKALSITHSASMPSLCKAGLAEGPGEGKWIETK